MSFEELQSVDTRAVKPEGIYPAGKKILLFQCGEGHCQGKL